MATGGADNAARRSSPGIAIDLGGMVSSIAGSGPDRCRASPRPWLEPASGSRSTRQPLGRRDSTPSIGRDSPHRRPGAAGDRPPDARLGPRRDLLPDLPRSLRAEPRASPSRRTSTPGAIAADPSRLSGGRPPRRPRAPRLPGRPRRQRDLLHADLPVGLEPPLSHPRLLPGRPDARRRRRPSAG